MESMARVLLDRPITETEWDALVDPDGGRYEILDGALVMSPSTNADHGRFSEDLADILRATLKRSELDLPVTHDIEWRTVADDVVTQAPRGDVVIGQSLDPERRIHNAPPLLVAEVWSHITSAGTRVARRGYWANLGLHHYWEVILGQTLDEAALEIWDLRTDAFPIARAVGYETIMITDPLELEISPTSIHGWTQRQVDRAGRAEQQTARADAAEAEVVRLRERLRQLDPDGV